jgi:hypothetical protein
MATSVEKNPITLSRNILASFAGVERELLVTDPIASSAPARARGVPVPA